MWRISADPWGGSMVAQLVRDVVKETLLAVGSRLPLTGHFS